MDPHYSTFDQDTRRRFSQGNYYNFHGDGRFVLTRIVDDGGVHVFELQAETRPRPPTATTGATWLKKLAFGIPGIISFQVSYWVCVEQNS